MFGIDFYPTPRELIETMIDKVDFKGVKAILEPSAGKGDIAECLRDKEYCNFKIDTIEIDQNLRHILKGKDFPVVHDDFLDFHTFKRYDLIIMNPPFSEGDKHLLKALRVMKHGGQIVCILNAETLRNPHTRSRAGLVQKLHELGADVEFIRGAFAKAERPTDVEIALVYVSIPEVRHESVILDHLRKAQPITHSEQRTFKGIIPSNYIDGLVQQYNAEVQSGLALIDDYEAMCPMFRRSLQNPYGQTLKLEMGSRSDVKYKSDGIRNQYVEAVRYKYWDALFQSSEITNKLTSNLQEELNSRIDEFMSYDFSFFNIFQLLEDLSGQTSKGIEKTILKLYDDFLKYSIYEGSKNVHYYSGWRTNSCHKVNKKVILPWLKAWDDWGDSFKPDGYKVIDRLNDIEKIFDFLDGKRTEQVNLLGAMEKAKSNGQSKKIPTKYFLVTFYKKGTCHLEFLDERLLKKFNLFGSQRKNWLPPSYGKKAYRDMEPEEQAVVDSFEGRASYEEVLANREYFIVPENGFAMLAPGTSDEAA